MILPITPEANNIDIIAKINEIVYILNQKEIDGKE